MYRTPHRVLSVPFLLVLAACAAPLKLSDETRRDYLANLRAEYLATNPDGPYNVHITQGEVVQGMDVLEVLVSWGHPDRRKKEGESGERWTYVERDEVTGDEMEYDLAFRQGVLHDWSVSRNFAKGGRPELQRTGTTEALTRDTSPSGKSVPKE